MSASANLKNLPAPLQHRAREYGEEFPQQRYDTGGGSCPTSTSYPCKPANSMVAHVVSVPLGRIAAG